GSPTVGSQGSYDLLSIAAVVLGGTVLMGGRGTIWGTIGGVATFAVLDNLMSVMQFNPFLKDVIRGLVIIIAVALYARRRLIARRIRFAEAGPTGASGAVASAAGSGPTAAGAGASGAGAGPSAAAEPAASPDRGPGSEGEPSPERGGARR